jgi:hypothetical protein
MQPTPISFPNAIPMFPTMDGANASPNPGTLPSAAIGFRSRAAQQQPYYHADPQDGHSGSSQGQSVPLLSHPLGMFGVQHATTPDTSFITSFDNSRRDSTAPSFVAPQLGAISSGSPSHGGTSASSATFTTRNHLSLINGSNQGHFGGTALGALPPGTALSLLQHGATRPQGPSTHNGTHTLTHTHTTLTATHSSANSNRFSQYSTTAVVNGANPVSKKHAPPTPPPAVLLRAKDLTEARYMLSHQCFTTPKSIRKVVTRYYRSADQLVVFVAVDDVICARAVMASDVIPRTTAVRTVPTLLGEVPGSWRNIFRVTNVSCFDDAALRLSVPVPVSDRSELASQVEPGFVISRVWNSTLLHFVEATVALSSGKAHQYDALLQAVDASDPEMPVPDTVKSLVSAVQMVSHGPGIVALAYIARYFGRAGREFVAGCLFELNAGVIDLCRQTMGGGLISYLVRHGTCATPRILQLVPWRVVATRVLSDAIGSQTASLMLYSALQFHRKNTRRALEPVAITSLTHRVLTKNFADATDPTTDCSLSSIAANAQSCRVLQLVVEGCVELLAMYHAGAFTTQDEVVHSAEKVIYALCDLADRHAADPWSNYATQSLITACTLQNENTPETIAKGRYYDAVLARVLMSVRPHIVRLSCHKCGSNVIEKLCSSRPSVTTEVAAALLESPQNFPRLAADRYGNYVVQTLLQYLPQTLEIRVRDALLPALSQLDPHWHCTVAIEGWCRKVSERERRTSPPGPSGVPLLRIGSIAGNPSPTGDSPTVAAASLLVAAGAPSIELGA